MTPYGLFSRIFLRNPFHWSHPHKHTGLYNAKAFQILFVYFGSCSCLGVCEGPRMTYIGLLCVVHCCLGISRCFEQADGPCRCKTSAVDQRLPGCSGTTFFNKRHRNPLKCYMLHCSLCSLHDLRSWA